MNTLHINNKEISYQSIKDKSYIELDFSEYEIQTLDFCHDWLNGKNEFVINTSGSTGTPKPITISRQQMIISANLTGNFLNLKSDDKSLIVLPTQYIAGMMMVVRGFILDMKMDIFEPSSNPLLLIDENVNYDFASFVPLQVFEIIKNTPNKIKILNSIKNILIGGGGINYNLEKELIKLTSNIYHTYGMTETVTHIALRKINGNDKKDSFTALENTKLSLDNRNCLMINSPVTNNKTIITNDIAEIISERTFKILGRIDNIINSGGIKIQPEKIESALDKILDELNLNINFFVSGIPDEKFGEIIVGVFEGNKFDELIIHQISNKLKLTLKKYEIPKKFLFIKEFKLTKTGKIDKKSILKKN